MTNSSKLQEIDAHFERYRKIHPKERASLAKRELFSLPRAGWVKRGVPHPESVGLHQLFIERQVKRLAPPSLNLEHAAKLAALHDLPEAIVTDITPTDPLSKEEKRTLERKALELIFEEQPEKQTVLALFEEYLEEKSAESRFVHDIDLVDPLFVAIQYEAKYGLSLYEEFRERAEKKVTTENGRELLAYTIKNRTALYQLYKKMFEKEPFLSRLGWEGEIVHF